MKNDAECKNPWMCSVLGFFLPLVGLIISAIIGKGTGVKHAFGGIVLRNVLIVGGCLLVFNKTPTTPDGKTSAAKIGKSRETAKTDERKTWEIENEKSPIDDSITYTIRREANAPVRGGFKKVRPVLIIRHKEGKSEAYVSWPMYLGNDKLAVTIRFDNDEAITEDWGCSTDRKAVFSPFPFADFLEMVLTSRSLVVRLTPYGESPETATFDISGFSECVSGDVLDVLRQGNQ